MSDPSTTAEDERPARLALGYVAVMTAVLIWAGWIVATREAVTRVYSPLDLALLRYGIPAVLLAPLWLRRGIVPRGEDWRLVAIMAAGWGGPFVLCVSMGLQTVPASLFGPLVPGMLPMVVAVWGVAVLGERLRRGRVIGLAFIAAAVALTVGPAIARGDEGLLAGVPWLLAACTGWSAFTIAYRNTTMTGLEAAAYTCLWSSPFLIAAALIWGEGLSALPLWDVAAQGLAQGVLSGLLSVVGYTYAVRALGLPRASAFTSLVPALAALGGWSLLGETVGPAGWAAIACACLGVLIVNRS